MAHIHTNRPGVLADINQVLAKHDVNIEGQMLATLGQTGYAVTDSGSPLSPEVVAELEAVPETIRLRVLG
jgi:D-3-phosphoglycerate dehydrogenase